MGYQTDYVGYLHVQPALVEAEVELVNAMSGSIFLSEPPGGALRPVGAREATLQEVGASPPRGWSNWAACSQGCCLSYDGGDKANHMIRWLKYLMQTFLVPDAAVHGRPGFEAFTCDHVLNGMVVGSRRDNRELFSISARENDVQVELLWPGVPEWSDYPPLRYQDEIDRVRDWVIAHRLEEARQRVAALRAEVMRGGDDPADW